MRPDNDSPEPLDLTYVLSRYPIAQETFVTGEMASIASMVRSMSIIGLARTREECLRPGGVPESVALSWVPRANSFPFWSGNARALWARPRWYGELLRSAFGPPLGRGSRMRWAHRFGGIASLVESDRMFASDAHFHSHFAAQGAVAASHLARAWRVPYSLTVHAYDIFQPNPHLAKLVRGAAVTIAISEADRMHVLELVQDVSADRVVVVHVGVPVMALETLAATIHRPSHSPRNHPLVVSVGRLVEKKGMIDLLRAIADLADAGRSVHCEIIGDGPERASLERLIAGRRIAGLVTLRGALPPEAARRRIAEADVFALACRPARNGDMDGIPVALMEAMATSTPVISTTISGIPELVRDAWSGRLVSPANSDSLAAAIVRALDQPAETARQVANARSHVAAEFDQASNARATLDAILAARERAA